MEKHLDTKAILELLKKEAQLLKLNQQTLNNQSTTVDTSAFKELLSILTQSRS